MKTKIYNNINSSFNFENVCLILSRFWMNEISIRNNSKIWLSITVYNKRNKEFTIIKNLPFNTDSYTDIVIVLKQVFNNSILPNKKAILASMIFSFYLENKYDWKEYSIDIIIFTLYAMFLACGTFILFYTVSELFNIVETMNNNTLVISSGTLLSDSLERNTYKDSNKCIFNILNDLFDKSSSSRYYPSYFIDSNININLFQIAKGNDNISLLDYITSKQFYVLDSTVQSFSEYFYNNDLLKYDLNKIAKEYSYYKQYCLT